MDKLHDSALSLTKELVALMKECSSAWESNKCLINDQLLVSECKKLTCSFDTMAPLVMELTEFLRVNAMKRDAVQKEENNMIVSSASPVTELAVKHFLDASDHEIVDPGSTSPVDPNKTSHVWRFLDTKF